MTFTRSSLAESGISLSTHVGRDGFGVTNIFAAKEATLTAVFFLKLVGLGYVFSVTYDFFLLCFFLFRAVLFGINVCIPKKSSVMNVWLLEISRGGAPTHTMWDFER